MGYSLGVYSGITDMHSFRRSFTMSTIEESMITALLTLGASLSPILLGGTWADRFGRKPIIIVSAIVCGIGTLVQTCAPAGKLWVILLGRFIGGFGVGGITGITPVYQAEIAPRNVRGALGMLWQLAITMGVMMSFWINTILSEVSEGWRWSCGLQLLLTAHLIVGMLQLSDTPRWYLLQKREDLADKTLMKLRRSRAIWVREEFAQMQMESRQYEMGQYTWGKLLRERPPSVIVGMGLMGIQQMMGINAIVFFAPRLLRRVALPSVRRLTIQGINGSVNFLSTLVAVVKVDNWGRVNMLTYGALICAVSLLFTGIFAAIDDVDNGRAFNETVDVCVVLGMIAFIFNFSYSWGLVWLLCAELVPTRYRSKGCAVTTSMNWFFASVIAIFVPYLSEVPGGTLYFFFVAMCLCAWLYARTFVPETKGRSLEDVEELCRRKLESITGRLLPGGEKGRVSMNSVQHARWGAAGAAMRNASLKEHLMDDSEEEKVPTGQDGAAPAAAEFKGLGDADAEQIPENEGGAPGARTLGKPAPGESGSNLGDVDMLSVLCMLDMVLSVLVTTSYLLLQAFSESDFTSGRNEAQDIIQNIFFGMVWVSVSLVNEVFILLLYVANWMFVLVVWKVFTATLQVGFAILTLPVIITVRSSYLNYITMAIAFVYAVFTLFFLRALWLHAPTRWEWRSLVSARETHEGPEYDADQSIRMQDVQFKRTPIGEGQNAKVYLGTFGNECLAVKEMTMRFSMGRGGREKRAFLRKCEKEVDILKRLRNHPNIVRYYGCGWEKPSFYIIMEYCPDNLRRYLERQKCARVDWATLVSFSLQICSGMLELHDRREPIIHFDLKPANILIKGGVLKITDYGNSRVIEEEGLRYQSLPDCVGTPHWMAPEMIPAHMIQVQMDGDRKAPPKLVEDAQEGESLNDYLRKHHSSKVDVYSFGIILWELASGLRPYPNCSQHTIFAYVSQSGRPVPDPVEDTKGRKAVGDLMRQSWSQNPSERPPFRKLYDVLKRIQALGEGKSIATDDAKNVKMSLSSRRGALSIGRTMSQGAASLASSAAFPSSVLLPEDELRMIDTVAGSSLIEESVRLSASQAGGVSPFSQPQKATFVFAKDKKLGQGSNQTATDGKGRRESLLTQGIESLAAQRSRDTPEQKN